MIEEGAAARKAEALARACDPRHDARVIRSVLVRAGLAGLLGAAAACGGPATPSPAPAHGASSHGAAAEHAGHHGDHHGGMPHRFEHADEWAKRFDDPARDAWQQPDRVLEALALSPAMVVADIGAGTGYFAVRLARAVPQGSVIATDIEPDMVRYMTERAKREGLANLRAVATPPDSPELAPSSVDRVLVVDVWHHLGDRAAYAKKLAEALRPGGRIAIVDYKLDAKRGPPPKHRLAPEAIAADLRGAGLTVEGAPLDLPEQYIVIGQR
jgi:SAM-dependent methyltransferase